jgi:hypothetical protein
MWIDEAVPGRAPCSKPQVSSSDGLAGTMDDMDVDADADAEPVVRTQNWKSGRMVLVRVTDGYQRSLPLIKE